MMECVKIKLIGISCAVSVSFAFGIALIPCTGIAASETDLPQFEISYPPSQINYQNRLEINPNTSETVIEVYSQFGIGRAQIKPGQRHWTQPVKVRLYLKGLEGFVVSNGNLSLDIEQLEVQAFNQQGQPINQKYLLDDAGYYEIIVPEYLFDDDLTVIELQWIDFYRN